MLHNVSSTYALQWFGNNRPACFQRQCIQTKSNFQTFYLQSMPSPIHFIFFLFVRVFGLYTKPSHTQYTRQQNLNCIVKTKDKICNLTFLVYKIWSFYQSSMRLDADAIPNFSSNHPLGFWFILNHIHIA